MEINAKGMHFAELDRLVKDSADENIVIDNVLGQRYIAAGAHGKHITINGIPGNALGAYLNDCTIEVNGNGQDAVGDTMNAGKIIIHGNCGDTAGYGMRDGGIFIRGYAGWRVGIHMKEYQQKVPAIVIGGRCGSFLGEYQAGGTIVVLGIGWEDRCPVGNFCGTGMHGGRIYLRTTHLPPDLPAQVVVSQATEEDISHLRPLVEEYCRRFQVEKEPLLASHYYVLRPNTKNPYKQLYVNN